MYARDEVADEGREACNTTQAYEPLRTGSATDRGVGDPLIWRLRREASSYGEQYERKRRAVEILERHPEFEELIELLRLVPIY
jgi:hypothetical protein